MKEWELAPMMYALITLSGIKCADDVGPPRIEKSGYATVVTIPSATRWAVENSQEDEEAAEGGGADNSSRKPMKTDDPATIATILNETKKALAQAFDKTASPPLSENVADNSRDTSISPDPTDSSSNSDTVLEDCPEEGAVDVVRNIPAYLKRHLQEVSEMEVLKEPQLSEDQLSKKFIAIEVVRSVVERKVMETCAQWENEEKMKLIELQEEAYEKDMQRKRKALDDQKRRVSLDMEKLREKRAKNL
jgi:hypothetical protein